MDLNDLFSSCRKGDLSRVQYLIEQKEVELNVRDKWDSSPLYYACLCGHYELVKYLLENGARCEANTFDGERCLYGALTRQIRNLLKNYKVVTSQSMRRDSYEEFLRKLLESENDSDVTYIVHEKKFMLHRCVLCARSEYFSEQFQTRWRNRDAIVINNPLVRPTAFAAVMRYIYTGRLETHIDHVDNCIRLAKQCRLTALIQQLEESVRKVQSFECTKPGTNVTTVLVEPPPDCVDLQMDLGILAEQSLPLHFCNWVGGSELPFSPDVQRTSYANICFLVGGYHFLCHKAFFCGRSDYFRALVLDHFSESSVDTEKQMHVIALNDVSAEVFTHIVYYIYQNTLQVSESIVYDVLCAADVYLLPGLKRLCANFLGSRLDNENIFCLLQTSRLFALPRLEDQCADYIAKYIENMVNDPQFHKIITEDAQEVKGRQETDSIAIVDDVRYHITSNVQTFSETTEANEKLQLIEQMLENLGLDA